MSFEELREAIVAEARQEASRLSTTLQEQIAAEQARILEKGKALEEKIITEAEQEGLRRAQQMRQEVELEGRALVLRAKEEELHTIRQAFIEQLLAEDAGPLLKALVALLPDEAGMVIAGEQHAVALRKLLKGKALSDEVLPGEGGFIFRGKTTELNVTVSQLVDRLLRKHRAEIASRLFS